MNESENKCQPNPFYDFSTSPLFTEDINIIKQLRFFVIYFDSIEIETKYVIGFSKAKVHSAKDDSFKKDANSLFEIKEKERKYLCISFWDKKNKKFCNESTNLDSNFNEDTIQFILEKLNGEEYFKLALDRHIRNSPKIYEIIFGPIDFDILNFIHENGDYFRKILDIKQDEL